MSDRQVSRSQVSGDEFVPEMRFGPVSAEKMKTMAVLLQDGNPIHWDVEAVRALGLGDRVINQGPITLGYMIETVASWAHDPGALKSIRARFLAAVHADETVVCGGADSLIQSDMGSRSFRLVARTESHEAISAEVEVRSRPLG